MTLLLLYTPPELFTLTSFWRGKPSEFILFFLFSLSLFFSFFLSSTIPFIFSLYIFLPLLQLISTSALGLG